MQCPIIGSASHPTDFSLIHKFMRVKITVYGRLFSLQLSTVPLSPVFYYTDVWAAQATKQQQDISNYRFQYVYYYYTTEAHFTVPIYFCLTLRHLITPASDYHIYNQRLAYCQSSSGNKRASRTYCQSRSGCAGMCMHVRLAIFSANARRLSNYLSDCDALI